MKIFLSSSYVATVQGELLGYVGENNSRKIQLYGYETEGASRYELIFSYFDETQYEVDITSGEYTIPASVLREPGTVDIQVVALTPSGEFIKKSNIVKGVIEESVNGESQPIPPYEDVEDMYEQILESAENAVEASRVAQESAQAADISKTEAEASAESARLANESIKGYSESAKASAQSAFENAEKATQNAAKAEQSSQLATEAKESAEESALSAVTSAETAKTNADISTEAKAAVEASKLSAESAATSAEKSKNDAAKSAQNALASEQSATQSSTSAEQNAQIASNAKTAAESAKTSAEASATSAEQSKNSAETASQSATHSATSALASANAAKSSETAVNAAKTSIDATATEIATTANEVSQNAQAAVNAKNDAESAKDIAVAKSQEIVESAEQIEKNVEDISQLSESITEIGKSIECESEIIRPFNKFDKTKIVNGYRMSSIGQIYKDTSGTYCVTDFCDISDLNSTKTAYAVGTNVNTPYSVYFALYNENKEQISYGNAGTGTIDSSNAFYFRAGVPLNRIDGFMVVDGTKVIPKYEPYEEPYSEVKAIRIDKIEKDIGGINDKMKVFYVGKDREYKSFSSAVNDALKYSNSIVYVDNGTYNMKTEFEEIYGSNFFSSFTSSSRRGLYLGNGIKIVLSPNAIIKFHYEGDNTDVKERFSPFNFAPYSEYSSPNYQVNGFEIIGGQIDVKNARYCSHDDPSSFNKEYTNKYKNVCMKLDNTGNLVWGSHACIGAGLGMFGTFEVEGCVFESVGSKSTTASVSLHNTGQPNARSFVSIKDNYLYGNNTIRLLWYGTSTLISKVIVCGNSVSRPIEIKANTPDSVVENIELLAWNNEIRTN